MRKSLKIVTYVLPIILGVLPFVGSAKGWEPVKSEKVQGSAVVNDSEIEIRTAGGTIYLTTSKSLHIKIFTILGSRIAEETLSPGSYQFAVPTHGVFIIKAGDLTCKVAV